MGYHPKGCKESNTTEWLSMPTAAGWIGWSSRVLGAWLAPFRSETCQMWFYYCSWLWDLAYRIISVLKKVLSKQSLPTVLSSTCLCVSPAAPFNPLFLQGLSPASTRLKPLESRSSHLYSRESTCRCLPNEWMNEWNLLEIYFKMISVSFALFVVLEASKWRD